MVLFLFVQPVKGSQCICLSYFLSTVNCGFLKNKKKNTYFTDIFSHYTLYEGHAALLSYIKPNI